jgi:mannose-6-phosphate isomerase-like protein (cupin superfamily)
MTAAERLKPVKDASHLYEVERRARHVQRPGFHISELQLSPTQTVPWHFHTNIADTFYVLEGEMRLFLQNPKEEVRLKPGETYTAVAKRPHLVTNAGKTSLTFLVLQGMGEYDYVPMV